MNTAHRTRLVLATVVAASFVAAPALAADASSLDRITDLYKNAAAGWVGPLLGYARALFAILVGIEVAWTLVRLGLKGADLGEFAAEMVNRIMFVGFFGWLMMNSGVFDTAIIDSFRQAGNAASASAGGSGGIRPSDIFDAGLQMATTVMSASVTLGLAGIGQSIALMLAAVVVCICFALMGAFLIVALVESYIVTSASVLLMGFGGSRWTKDFAVKAITYAVSVGAKLFMIQLIAGMGESIIKSQAASLVGVSAEKPEDVLVVVGFSIVMLALTKTIPDTVQGLINGVSPSTAGGGIVAATVGGAIGGAVANTLGAGSAVFNAARLASQQLGGGQGGEGGGKPGAMALGGQTLKNMAGGAMKDVGARLAGHGQNGTMGGRMGHAMAMEAREASRSNAKPEAPAMPASASAPSPAAAATPEPAGSIRPAEGGGAAQSPPAESTSPQSSAAPAMASAAADAAPGGADTVRGAGGADSPAPTAAVGPSAAVAVAEATSGQTAGTVQSASARASEPAPAAPNLGSRLATGGAPARGTVQGAKPSKGTVEDA